MRKKTILFLFILLAILTHFNLPTQAHAPGPLPPHGGQIYQTGNYFLEMVVYPGEIRLYVLNRHYKTMLPDGTEGTLILKFPDGSQANSPFKSAGNHLVTTPPPSMTNGFIALANVKIKGKIQIGRFAF